MPYHLFYIIKNSILFCRKFLLVDPSDKEEKVMEGKMVIGMNKHREICTLQVTGQMMLLKDQVVMCLEVRIFWIKVQLYSKINYMLKYHVT